MIQQQQEGINVEQQVETQPAPAKEEETAGDAVA